MDINELVLERAERAVLQPPDPLTTAIVVSFGQLYVVADRRQRLLGLAVYDQAHGTLLCALPGRDEYGDWHRAHLENQKARRARERAS